MRELLYRHAIREALDEELARDDKVVVMGEEVAQYNVSEKTHVTWGLYANTNEVSVKADDLQTRKLAFKLAEEIRQDCPRLTQQLGK